MRSSGWRGHRTQAASVSFPFHLSKTAIAEYRVVTVKPSDIQKEMVEELGNRAERVRNGMVNPMKDNLVFSRYPVPSGASSMAVTVSPNVDAHASKCCKPFFNQ